MGKGGGGGGDSTTQVKPPGFVKPYLKDAASEAGNLYSQGPQEFYPGSPLTARFDPLQMAGFGQNLGFAQGQLPQLLQSTFGSFGNALNAGDIYSDPSVQAGLDTIESRANQNFLESTLPGLRRAGIGAGQEYGTRPELAAGVAASRLGRDIGDAQGQFLANQLGSSRQLQGAGLAVSPQIAALGLTPGAVFGDVGAQFRGLEQADIAEQVARHDFGQQAPANLLNEYINQLSGLSGGYATQQTRQDGGSGTLGNVIGGGLLGNAFAQTPLVTGFSPFAGLGAFGGLPAIAGGALLGGLLS